MSIQLTEPLDFHVSGDASSTILHGIMTIKTLKINIHFLATSS